MSRSVRAPDYRVRLTAAGWYVDGQPVTEQKAYETLDHIEETKQSRTE